MIRLAPLCVFLLACEPSPGDTDVASGLPPLTVDMDASWGEDPDAQRYVRATHLVFDGGALDLSFNNSGHVLAEELPPGASTPWLPLPTGVVSAQLLDPGSGTVIYDSGDFDVPPGGFATIGSFGIDANAAPLTVYDDPRPAAGQVKYRIMHVVPGMPTLTVLPAVGQIGGAAAYGQWTEYDTFSASTPQKPVIDLGVNGIRIPYETFELPEVDSQGFGQVINIYLIPSGQFLPSPPVPIPAMLVQPMDSPDGIVVLTPDL